MWKLSQEEYELTKYINQYNYRVCQVNYKLNGEYDDLCYDIDKLETKLNINNRNKFDETQTVLYACTSPDNISKLFPMYHHSLLD